MYLFFLGSTPTHSHNTQHLQHTFPATHTHTHTQYLVSWSCSKDEFAVRIEGQAVDFCLVSIDIVTRLVRRLSSIPSIYNSLEFPCTQHPQHSQHSQHNTQHTTHSYLHQQSLVISDRSEVGRMMQMPSDVLEEGVVSGCMIVSERVRVVWW